MSDQIKNNQREKFKIEVTEPTPFDAIAESKYLTSNELCRLTSELFKSVFADYEGCIFEATNGEPTMSLIFNHGKYDNDAVVACERAGGKVSGSMVLDRTRNRDRQLQEGDRYYLTEDGKDVVMSLLTSRTYNNGNPNWRNIVSEWTDRTVMNMYSYQQLPQYTKVSFIDLRNLCRLIFGNKIDGDTVDYAVSIASSLTPNGYQAMGGMSMNMNYMLNITRASAKEVAAVYEKLGFGSMGTRIVRG